MSRVVRYSTSVAPEAELRQRAAEFAAELGHPLLEVAFERTQRGYDVVLVLDAPEPTDPLVDRVRRFVGDVEGSERWTVQAEEPPLADLFWDPIEASEAVLAEAVRLSGSKRWAVVGLLGGEYRFATGGHAFEAGQLGASPVLETALQRVLKDLASA